MTASIRISQLICFLSKKFSSSILKLKWVQGNNMSGENRKIWIGNVPATMTEWLKFKSRLILVVFSSNFLCRFQLLQLCRREGHLTSFQPFIGGNRPSSYSTRGFAFAEYSTMAEATEAAKNLRGRVINGCRLRCQFARETTSQVRLQSIMSCLK